MIDLVGARLRQEMRRRGVTGVDARLAAEMLFGMIRAVCMYRGEADRIDDLTQQVTRLFLRGVLAPRGEGSRQRTSGPRRLRAVGRG
jgi:hypothetical protein